MKMQRTSYRQALLMKRMAWRRMQPTKPSREDEARYVPTAIAYLNCTAFEMRDSDMATDKETPGKPKKRAQKPVKQPKTDLFTTICKSDLKIEVVKEYLFHPTRKWRFDYAIPEHMIALEVEGGVWTGGRHTRPQGFLGDIEKYNAGTLLGWRIFRVTPDDLCRMKTLELIKQAISVPEQFFCP